MQGPLQTQSDSEILRRVLAGDVNAFEGLMERYGDHVLKIVKRHVPKRDVEEMTQEVFVRAYQSLPALSEEGKFRQWLSTIATRTCCDYWRKSYQSREVPMSGLSDKHRQWLEEVLSDRSTDTFEERGSQNEAEEVLHWALARLSPEDRMVLDLVYLEGLSGKEAALRLGWSVANVKVRSFRARGKLEKLFRGHITT